MRYVLLSLVLVTTQAQAQTLFSAADGSNPPIYNRAYNPILPVATPGVTPTAPISGSMAMSSIGQICVFNGSNWVRLGAVNIVTGLALGCSF